jgi:hypothetical protein
MNISNLTYALVGPAAPKPGARNGGHWHFSAASAI